MKYSHDQLVEKYRNDVQFNALVDRNVAMLLDGFVQPEELVGAAELALKLYVEESKRRLIESNIIPISDFQDIKQQKQREEIVAKIIAYAESLKW